MATLRLDPATTALALIDRQQGIVSGRSVPHTAVEPTARNEPGFAEDAMAASEADPPAAPR